MYFLNLIALVYRLNLPTAQNVYLSVKIALKINEDLLTVNLTQRVPLQ